jgi:hypothetical protein
MSTGKKNAYICPFDHITITIEVDDGTTPMLLRCRQKSDDGKHACTEMARSSWYNLTPSQEAMDPEYEWYKPNSGHVLNKQEKDHVRKGGLLLRKIKKPQT